MTTMIENVGYPPQEYPSVNPGTHKIFIDGEETSSEIKVVPLDRGYTYIEIDGVRVEEPTEYWSSTSTSDLRLLIAKDPGSSVKP